ncbi:SDR family oxidoreductase [Rhodanobacter sp. 7MK24]|uniref:SDR family oxidoreductase n=1 Tax=Rhodanobacter sp. 7MK24 TaxID=2775922 RepID=UPI001784398F|nr:SDR family oxidoreductase [Rhodanobacter sp. 7MK24]
MNTPSPNPLDLTGCRYLVTGGASGIGRATAGLFAALGARVSLIDLDGGVLGELADSLPGSGHDYHVHDLADVDGIDALVRKVVSEGGLLHGMVHAAGTQVVMPARDIKPETWRHILAVNTEAALALARNMARKRVCQGGGSVVFISSIMALAGGAGSVAYSMSKSALHGLARSLALELAPIGVRVNCIAPGFVRTPMFDRLERGWDAAQRDAVEALHPLGFGEAEDIAHAAAFLVAATGRWITGTVLVVDGGYLAK